MSRAKRKQLNLPNGAETLNRELYMARRLMDHGCDVFAGSSNTATRKACFRRVITQRGLEHTILGKDSSGKCLTYAQAFERTYGEALQINDEPPRAAVTEVTNGNKTQGI